MKAAGARDLARSSVLAKYPKVTEEFGMLAGKRVHKQIILAMVTAVLLLAATSRTARALPPTCTAPPTGTGCYGVEFINYFSNAVLGNNKVYVRVIDPFEFVGAQPAEICSMFYVFDPFQELQECCGCPVTPDGLLTLSVGLYAFGGNIPANFYLNGNLTSNAVSSQQFFYNGTPPQPGRATLEDGVIRILSTQTNASTTPFSGGNFGKLQGTAVELSPGVYCDRHSGQCCDPTGDTGDPIAPGGITLTTTLRAWADHTQGEDPDLQTASVTNTAFEEVPITVTDAESLAELCAVTLSTGEGNCNCGNEFIDEERGFVPDFGEGTGGDGTN
jgi:hypothetical protein